MSTVAAKNVAYKEGGCFPLLDNSVRSTQPLHDLFYLSQETQAIGLLAVTGVFKIEEAHLIYGWEGLLRGVELSDISACQRVNRPG